MKPWLTDPKYGGMSEESARLSHESWVRQGRRVLTKYPRDPRPPQSDAAIELIKRQIEAQLSEYVQELNAYGDWMRNWRAKNRRKGFRRARGAA
jgi:hypothetical protein